MGLNNQNTEARNQAYPANQLRNHVLLMLAVLVLSLFLWNTFLMVPIKLFVVSLHELSHGLAAVISGGEIVKIQISPKIGGYCMYRIPADTSMILRIFISSAGYLGSMFWGALIFIASSRMPNDRIITGIVAVAMGILSVFVIRTGELFGILFTIASVLFLIISLKWFSDRFHDLFLKFLGLSSCFYVITDIKSDLIDRSGIGSDADQIARMLGSDSLSVPIGILWILMAIAVLVFSIRKTLTYNGAQTIQSDRPVDEERNP